MVSSDVGSQFSLTREGNEFHFFRNGSLWRGDGTVAGTVALATHSTFVSPNSRVFEVNGRLVYGGNNGLSGSELWSLRAEVRVTANGVVVTDGDTLPSAHDHTDFGIVAESGGSRRRTFTIRNDGRSDLRFNGSPLVSLSGPGAADFVVTKWPDEVLAPDGRTTFEIEFNPSMTGVRSATVRIADDRDGGQPFEFAIQGTGALLDFGDAPSAEQSALTVSYPTMLADDGARHGVGGPRLGAFEDAEADGQPSDGLNADGTFRSATDDDGVQFLTSLVTSAVSSTTATVAVEVGYANLLGNRLEAWIDFNRDGDWLDPGEQIFRSADLGATSGVKLLSHPTLIPRFCRVAMSGPRLVETATLSVRSARSIAGYQHRVAAG